MLNTHSKAFPQNHRTIFIEKYLDPIRGYLLDNEVSEICVNTPYEIWVEKTNSGHMECHTIKELTPELLKGLSTQIAAYSDQAINHEMPLLSASLPSGERIQIILPPLARNGIALSIRKQVTNDLSLDDLEKQGSFTTTRFLHGSAPRKFDRDLSDFYKKGDFKKFVSHAAKTKKNILISGGTSSGKTTLLSAILREVDKNERIITIEDTPEIHLHHKNYISLIASKGEQGASKVSVQDLLESSLRMRPDRLLVGELRGKEAYSFLRAINTGHPGSITTIHADTPSGAFEQICLMVMQAGLGLTHQQIKEYITSIIDIVIQLRKVGGRRVVTDIWIPDGRI